MAEQEPVRGVAGEAVDRIDGRAKVTGSARYTAEFEIARLAYGVIVQSAIARGRVTMLDTAAALKAPGVIDVMSVRNAPKLPEGGRAGIAPPAGRALSLLQDRAVRYNGEPIAVVI